TKVVSPANTAGNAEAAKQYLASHKTTGPIALVTNYFHLLRALKDFSTVTEAALIPLASEAVVYAEEYDNIRHFYETEGTATIIGEVRGQNSEIKGLRD